MRDIQCIGMPFPTNKLCWNSANCRGYEHIYMYVYIYIYIFMHTCMHMYNCIPDIEGPAASRPDVF